MIRMAEWKRMAEAVKPDPLGRFHRLFFYLYRFYKFRGPRQVPESASKHGSTLWGYFIMSLSYRVIAGLGVWFSAQ
jgi:hypothetical protein